MYIHVYVCIGTHVCCNVLYGVAVCWCVVQCVTACCDVLPPSFLLLPPSAPLPASLHPHMLLFFPLFRGTVFTQHLDDFLHFVLVA